MRGKFSSAKITDCQFSNPSELSRGCQETVIINGFTGQIPYDELLRLIDKYLQKFKRRGREPTSFLAKHIIITSRLHPKDVYYNRYKEDSLAQLYKRIKIRKSEFSESS